MRQSLVLAGLLCLALPSASALATTYRADIISRGSSPFKSVDGIFFNLQGKLLVLSGFSSEIDVVNPLNGHIEERMTAQSDDVQAPADLTVGSDGSIYWVEIFSGRIVRRYPDGTRKVLANLGAGADAINLSNDGRLFASTVIFSDQLWEVDPNGVNAPRLVTQNNLGGLNEFAFGPDNMLYGPKTLGDSVLRVNVDTGEVTTVATGFASPIAVKFDHQGKMYVADELGQKIYRVDTTTGAKTPVANVPRGSDTMAFDAHDTLFYGSAANGLLARVLPSGVSLPLSRPGMELPGGVAVVPGPLGGDNVFVADLFSLREFSGLTGLPLSVEVWQGASQFNGPGVGTPQTVSVDGNNNLILTSWFTNQVRVWNPALKQMLALYTNFATPVNAIAYQNDILVAQLGAQPGQASVVRASDGAVFASGFLAVPVGLASSGGNAWVSDNITGVIWQIAQNGAPLNPPVAVTSGLNAPEGLAVAADGGLLVVEVGTKSVLHVDLQTGATEPVAIGLELGVPAFLGQPPMGVSINSVAVGHNGAIYVTGDITNVLYRLTPVQQSVKASSKQ